MERGLFSGEHSPPPRRPGLTRRAPHPSPDPDSPSQRPKPLSELSSCPGGFLPLGRALCVPPLRAKERTSQAKAPQFHNLGHIMSKENSHVFWF